MDTKKNSQGLSRRDFVTGAVASAAVLGLAACSATDDTGVALGVPTEWDKEADVVVVGAGGGGLMAACAAQESGSVALLIEKAGNVGGDTAKSAQCFIGIWPARAKQDSGVDDTIDAYMTDWKASHKWTEKGKQGVELPAEFPLSIRMLELNPETYEWMQTEAGIEWMTAGWQSEGWYPQPQWNTQGPRQWYPASTGLIPPLQAKAEALGVETLTETMVWDLITADDGRVIGVRAYDGSDTPLVIKANKAVVLATGSFNANMALMARYIEGAAGSTFCGGCVTNTGDGHLMVKKVGGAWADMDLGTHWMTYEALTESMGYTNTQGYFGGIEGSVPISDMPGILINYDGKRFMSESLGYKWVGDGIAGQKYHEAFYVFDSSTQLHDWMLGAAMGDQLFYVASDWAEMAAYMQVPADVLAAEVKRYNGFIAAGADTDFEKQIRNCQPIATPPFYAVRMRPRHYTTYGGIAVDADSRVLTPDGAVIPGLYAAGTCCGSLCEQEGLYYGGGVAQTLTFGRQAGKLAAAEEAWA